MSEPVQREDVRESSRDASRSEPTRSASGCQVYSSQPSSSGRHSRSIRPGGNTTSSQGRRSPGAIAEAAERALRTNFVRLSPAHLPPDHAHLVGDQVCGRLRMPDEPAEPAGDGGPVVRAARLPQFQEGHGCQAVLVDAVHGVALDDRALPPVVVPPPLPLVALQSREPVGAPARGLEHSCVPGRSRVPDQRQDGVGLVGEAGHVGPEPAETIGR